MDYVLCEGFGEKDLRCADRATVLAIYQDEYRGHALAQYQKYFCRYDGTTRSAPVRYLRVDDLALALVDVLTLPVGAKSARMRWVLHGAAPKGCTVDPRMPVFIQEAWKAELLLWLAPHVFQRHIAFKDWLGLIKHMMRYQGLHPERDLSFLSPFVRWICAPGQVIEYITDEESNLALLCFSVERMLSRSPDTPLTKTELKDVLELCNAFSHRDVRYTYMPGPTS